jgi:LacI family transcriptional regulator
MLGAGKPATKSLLMARQAKSPDPRRPRLPTGESRQVALLVETRTASSRDILRGIGRYVREHGRWALVHEHHTSERTLPQWMKEWRGDGIIARVHDHELGRIIADMGMPAVDVLGEIEHDRISLVHVDDHGIARLAAEHLLERGFRHFGFFGLAGRNWSDRRRAAFQESLARSGHGLAVYEQSSEYRLRVSWEFRESRIADWIRHLPKPAGVLVCSDQVGLDFLEACRHAGVAEPDEVAVLGVDNDEAFCEIGNPSLSSIWPSHTQVGYEAAALLDRLMNGERPPAAPTLIPPGAIKVRQSSDVLAIDDSRIAKALHLIRANACAGLGVDEVATKTGLSRSVLQRRFRQILGKTVHDEILSAKLKRACQLLAETDFQLVEVAEQCGFKHQEYMGVVFRERLKQTPAQYRRNAKQSARPVDSYQI